MTIITPQLTQAPSMSAEGLLALVGFFPTQPRKIEFHIVYQPVNGEWKLFGLTVRLAAPETPVPPTSAAPATPPQTEAKTGTKTVPPAAPPAAKKN